MESYTICNRTVPVLIGTCAWTDVSFTRDSHFFPAASRKNAETLIQHYATALSGQVEIDTSTYAIPSRYKLQEWVNAVPDGFVFHIKAFGFLCSRGGTVGSLPRDLRQLHLSDQLMNDPLAEQKHMTLAQLPAELVDQLWERMNEAIAVLHEAGKLGAVLFQMHASSFPPTVANMRYLAESRMRLRHPPTGALYPMAVEFREHAWFSTLPPPPRHDQDHEAGGHGDARASGVGMSATTADKLSIAVFPESEYPPEAQIGRPIPGTCSDPVPPLPPSLDGASPHALLKTQRQATLYFFRRMGIALVAADDLAEELPVHEPAQPCTRDGRVLIPEDITCPSCAYVRIHRRTGDYRLLSGQETHDWAQRAHRMAATAGGPAHYASACSATVVEQPICMSRGRKGSGPAAHKQPVTQPAEDVHVDASAGSSDNRPGPSEAYSLSPELPLLFPASLGSSLAGPVRGQSSGTPQGAAGTQSGVYLDHPWFFTKLQGPICINVATYHADQPIVNIRQLREAIDGCTLPLSEQGASTAEGMGHYAARMYDWKTKMAQYHKKHGLEGFFARQKEQQSSPSTLGGKRGRQEYEGDDTASPGTHRRRPSAGESKVAPLFSPVGLSSRPLPSSATGSASSSSVSLSAGKSAEQGAGGRAAAAASATVAPTQKQLTSFFALKR